MKPLKFGLTLANRALVRGHATVDDLLAMADRVEASRIYDSLWVGDALYVNQRLDALTLLAAIAGRTKRVLLGPACMGSFALRDPLVFAYEWASLDRIAKGRTRLIVCSGGGGTPAWAREGEALAVPAAERRARMCENIEILRHLWRHDGARFEGRFRSFEGLTLEPKPVGGEARIWLATNSARLAQSEGDGEASEIAVGRVARYADGWMTHSISPAAFDRSWRRIGDRAAALGRDPAGFDNCLYHNIVIDEDRDRGLARAKAFLDDYYGLDFEPRQLQAMVSLGSPQECAESLRAYRSSAVKRVALRICVIEGALEQFDRLTTEVLPLVNG